MALRRGRFCLPGRIAKKSACPWARSIYQIRQQLPLRGMSMSAASPNFSANDLDLSADMRIHYFHRPGGDNNLVLLHPSS
jgi:hypothetical protein